jgi:hypothetical protein
MGGQAKELISADFERTVVWDLSKGEIKANIEASQISEGNSLDI